MFPIRATLTDEEPISGARAAIVCVALFAAALAIRTVALERIPPGNWYDEAINGLDALDILEKGRRPIFFVTEGHPREPMFLYLTAFMFRLCGASTWALRWTSAWIGALTVAVFWLMLNRLRGAAIATVAAVALVFFRWHLHFSRTSFRTILAPLFICLAVWGVARAARSRRLRDWAMAGVFLGAGFYTYLSFRFVPILLGVWAAAACWVWRRRLRQGGAAMETPAPEKRPASGLREIVNGASVALAIAFAVFLPLGIDYLKNPFHFSGRLDEVSLFDEGLSRGFGKAADNAVANVLQFFLAGHGDHVPKHNIPLQPVFDPLNALIFLIGLLVCIFNFAAAPSSPTSSENPSTASPLEVANSESPIANRRSAISNLQSPICNPLPASGALALGWLVLMLSSSVFSFGAPNLLRTVAATPAVMWIWAEGLMALSRLAAGRAPRRLAARVQAAILVAVLAWFGGSQAYDYFFVFPRSPGVWSNFNTGETDLGRALAAIDPNRETACVPSKMLDHPTVRFESHGAGGLRYLTLPEAIARDPEQPARDRLILATIYNGMLPSLKAQFPGGSVAREFETPNGEAWAWLYRVPAAQLPDPATARQLTGEPRNIPE